MATIQQQIVEKFLAELVTSGNVDVAKTDGLRALLSTGKKPNVDELVRIFSLPAGGDFK